MHRWGDVPLAVPDHVAGITIAHDVADVIVPRDHRLAGRTRVTPRDLVDEDWIATPEGTICRQWLIRMYDGTGRPPRIAHVVDGVRLPPGARRARGSAIALVPRLGRAPLGTSWSRCWRHDPVPTRDIVALHRRTMADSPAVTRRARRAGARLTGRRRRAMMRLLLTALAQLPTARTSHAGAP